MWEALDCAQGTTLSLWLAALEPLRWWEAGGQRLEAHPVDKPAKSDRNKMLEVGLTQ